MTSTVASDAYARWVGEWIARGFDPYMITFMFKQLPGANRRALLEEMRRSIEMVYALYVTKIIRKPLSPSSHNRLPVWMLAPDLPVYKRQKQCLRAVSINDGLHFQGIALEPMIRRIEESLDEHFFLHEGNYRSRCPRLERVHVKPITHDIGYVSEYLFKTVHRGLVSDNDLLILPREISELKAAPAIRGNSSIFG